MATTTLVIFTLAGDRFAVVADRVRQVVRAVEVTSLPGAPAVVPGVIDVRGVVVPVFDLRRRFGMSEQTLHAGERFILVDAAGRLAALRVDAAEWLESVPADAITAAATVTPAAAHVAGTVRLADGLVVLHDVETFLTRAESDTLDEALRAHAAPAREPDAGAC